VDSKALPDVKSQTQRWTQELVEGIAPELIEDVWQNDRGSLLSCTETSWSWSGAAEVRMKNEIDLMPVLENLGQAWKTEPGRTSSLEKTGMGNPRLVVTTPSGTTIIVDARADGRRVHLSSYSECFSDLGDYTGGPSY
jgi:hypothetical protein